MKVYDIIIDVLNILFLILITFFIFSIVNTYCSIKDITKFTLIFTLLINNFIVINYTKMLTENTYVDNILGIAFIFTLLLILMKAV